MIEDLGRRHLPVIDAREVLSRIENGSPVIYDHVAIAGDLDLRKIDLPRIHFERPAGEEQTASTVACSIQIRNCELLGNVNLDHALFREGLDLCGSVFFQEARFKGVSFSGGAKFESCRFHRYATFKDAYFSGCARFQGAAFSAIANFGGAVFSCPAHFGQCSFSELCTNFGEAKMLEDADFTDARFSGTANFRLASFCRSASFWKTAFLGEAIFQGGRFSGYASFQSAEIAGEADFRGALFDDELNFEFARLFGSSIFLGACLKGEVNFFRAEMGEVNFTDAVFLGDMRLVQGRAGRALFAGCQFQKDSSFAQSIFQDDASFQRAIFQGDAFFSGSRFLGSAGFRQAVFSRAAVFSAAFFSGEADCRGARFCSEADFASSEFQSAARFDSARFQGSLDLSRAKINILRLLDGSVSGKIDLHNTEFLRLEARWPALAGHLACDGAAYLSLVKNFRNLEWFEDADDCYYHYRRAGQSAKGFLVRGDGRTGINWSKLSDALAWISCGYGVRPGHTVFLSGILIILFALFYWIGGGIVVEPLNGSGASIGSQGGLGFLDHLYFSTMVFTAKTLVKWYPVGIYRYIATIESVLGWLLLALFLVSLGRTMIR
ncbi:MAG TPA: pentapeptide repeat-containing protein [Methanothrix sp.]|nr:pentapeptide repeat-containing protein [Methanothrix sp.]HPC89735.1 pentapeptide repeat-containing protein [Methanothrix sp.]HQE87470.1 pentapeptide repeat-containing protein [Methanothrix sp.]HQI68838.1 pentapeptide repeat-containing protein [Methanothrix sp.]HRS85033.1 pentapeptide repeat-containing protein [Methanothrix sp.]